MNGYKKVRVNISEAQAKKAMTGMSIRLKPDQIGNGEMFLYLHPANAKIIEKAALKNSGCNIHLSHGELLETASQMNGSGFWGTLWKSLKSGWNALKNSGVLTAAADAAVAPLSAYTGQPALVAGARNLLKKTTGVGVQSGISKRSVGRMTKAQRLERLKGSGLYLS